MLLAFFVVELAVRIRRAGWRRFFIGRWNCFDAAVIALSTMPVLGVDASLLRVVHHREDGAPDAARQPFETVPVARTGRTEDSGLARVRIAGPSQA